jgi:hypothetical protein
VNADLDIGGLKKTEAPPAYEFSGSTSRTAMGLFHNGNRINAVRVGESWTAAKEIFPEPPRGSYEIHDLPAQFGNNFQAQGWETNRDEGFGAILTDNKIVAAMYQLEHQREDVVDGYIHEEEEGLRPLKRKRIMGGPVAYWFWHSGTQTTMICKLQTKNGFSLTMAMGDDDVLKQLGISEEDANNQIAELVVKPAVGA